MTPHLAGTVQSLLDDTLAAYPRVATLRHQRHRWTEPLRVAVAGRAGTGKSTLVNALIGDRVAPVTPPGDTTTVWYQDGAGPRATAYPRDGEPFELPLTMTPDGPRTGQAEGDLVIHWPSRALRQMTLLDTPADGASLDDADAVLHLSPAARPADLEPLRTHQHSAVARATPIATVLVLSRADEVNGGRTDAFVTARQIARRHGRDPAVRDVCLRVHALGGLAAATARTLTDAEFETIAHLAALPRTDTDGALLSTDRYLRAGLPPDLLHRLGLPGVRLATVLARTGHDTRLTLAGELARRSGVTELRDTITRGLIARTEALKARATLLAIESVLDGQWTPRTDALRVRLGRILAEATEFREMRLVAALPELPVRFAAELEAEAHRLAGGDGTDIPSRLGLDEPTDAPAMRRHCDEALLRWQVLAEGGTADRRQRRAATIVVESCASILDRLGV
ncbi:hypothetical protein J2S43_008130 [Catenuloplanes nepalensis]|uniref:G domain-containing protein n=1 Tax=Catenuloplanes nepalensis TaxID=587533 RepID=A0ABT9N7E7_9ACTN|nr:GTPase domain-containing protein [Catenuloplanes nepalensis]MDP9799618.1 hypothetical protein [Catenuloplanes nepalensis]